MRECPVCGSSEIVTDFRDDPDTDETETDRNLFGLRIRTALRLP
jgi:hypothetical protein